MKYNEVLDLVETLVNRNGNQDYQVAAFDANIGKWKSVNAAGSISDKGPFKIFNDIKKANAFLAELQAKFPNHKFKVVSSNTQFVE